MLEEHFTYQNAQKELLYKHKNYCYKHVGNYGNRDVKLRNQGQQKIVADSLLCSGYFWLCNGKNEMEGSEKVHFSTEKPTIYCKSLWDLPEILLLP